ncbi:GNAT family N-acetyltransferase [[Clostridium] symbiosum]|uniref:GNAT family N-acetyltransferase n=1 Tax=Clostridium symbiosum TaxID=1512 RepID=UPI00232D8C1B|nr:GNAT family N-acetyltransferase [[Clostridium] symbiosum]MDB2011292.1 GNAT family N-acetyltransferase [[Clostridium] symbiosum]MDB2028891.1 GNAT family N-acetyltransferase [[Clostridium] symbiosum]
MLRLRPYKPADAGYLMKWLEDERTVEFWKADRFCWPLTAEQLADYCEDFTADPAAAAFTALDGAGNPAGHFSFRQIDWAGNRAHMGFIIVDPGCRGKGHGREMVRLALQYARLCLGLDFVTLGVYDCNEPARRLYEAEGFVKADRLGEKQTGFRGETWTYYYMEADLRST